jgi:hypothetical protein
MYACTLFALFLPFHQIDQRNWRFQLDHSHTAIIGPKPYWTVDANVRNYRSCEWLSLSEQFYKLSIHWVAILTNFGSRSLAGKLDKSHIFVHQVQRTVATPLSVWGTQQALSVGDKRPILKPILPNRHTHFLVVYPVLTIVEMTESQRYNCFTRNGGNNILKHAGSEAKAACTHTGFLPESDPAPVVEFFTRTGITAAGGQHR